MHRKLALDIDSILQRISVGDAQAFAMIVDRYQGPLFGYLGRLGLAQVLAEELAQETFLRAWRGLGSYRPERAAFSTWLFTIARNLAIDELKSLAQRPEIAGCDPLPDPASDDAQPLELLQAAQEQRRLRSALRQLPMADRSALALVYNHELDLAQVARIEDCTPGAIKVRLHRARQRLRELMEQEYIEHAAHTEHDRGANR